MGGAEIAKDAISIASRIATTAGLSKDVIDLLKEKIALLAEQNAAFEKENATLKKKVTDLEQQLDRLRPKSELHQDAIRFLQLLFQQDGLTVSQVASTLGIKKGMAEFHRDVLKKAKLIGLSMVVTMDKEPPYYLRPAGREYLVKQGHV